MEEQNKIYSITGTERELYPLINSLKYNTDISKEEKEYLFNKVNNAFYEQGLNIFKTEFVGELQDVDVKMTVNGNPLRPDTDCYGEILLQLKFYRYKIII